MRMRDELELTYHDDDFIELYSYTGQPAKSPAFLALVSVMQFAEGLTDKQAAQAVPARWFPICIRIEIEREEFWPFSSHHIRKRLLDGEMERHLFDHMLSQLSEKGLLKAGGKQRTDSTHVLAAIRKLNRVECVGAWTDVEWHSHGSSWMVTRTSDPWLVWFVWASLW